MSKWYYRKPWMYVAALWRVPLCFVIYTLHSIATVLLFIGWGRWSAQQYWNDKP